MNIKEIIKSNPLVNYLHLEYWRHRGQRELKKFNDYDFICWMYKKKCGRALDLSDPKRYTEKLQWLKLFYRNDLMPIASDKYEVREYLKSLGYDYLLNELIGVYNSVDEIDFSKLPERFVVKASHGSHWNLIVKDKTKINWRIWKKIMKSWLKQNLYWFGREWNYKSQTPRIVVEQYLEDDSGELRDYKIFCFNGKPCFMQIDQNRFSKHKRLYVDPNGQPLNFSDSSAEKGNLVFCFSSIHKEMLRISEELSKPFPVVRVDLYECGGKIYFGELTFFDGSGFYSFNPDSVDEELGAKIRLPEPNYNLELYNSLTANKRGL